MYVRATVIVGYEKGFLIPQRAATRNATGALTAMFATADNKVEQRVLSIDRAVGNQWWVTSGLNAGDQVIVEGGQKVRVGNEVLAQNSETRSLPTRAAPTAIAKEG